jgi:isoamylase
VAELPPRPAAGGSGVDLIAEPWAIGGNSYQVGGFPSGWAEWNGGYRDVVRQAQNKLGSVAITPGQMASRFAGSSDLYGDDGRKPWHSVNFITAHDGFTLKDLYSCNSKNNSQAWPYGRATAARTITTAGTRAASQPTSARPRATAWR